MSSLKDSLLQAIETLPDTTIVGLITYGNHVYVHELGFETCFKSYAFRGAKETVDAREVQEQLGVLGLPQTAAQPSHPGAAPSPPNKPQGALGRFMCPLGDCEFQITALIEEMQPDAFPIPSEQRAARCTGTAIAVAGALMASARPAGQHCRAMLFVGGACA